MTRIADCKLAASTLLAIIAGATDLFLYFFNSDIFFNWVGLLDPFMGIGAGLYYDRPQFWEDYYKISRSVDQR